MLEVLNLRDDLSDAGVIVETDLSRDNSHDSNHEVCLEVMKVYT